MATDIAAPLVAIREMFAVNEYGEHVILAGFDHDNVNWTYYVYPSEAEARATAHWAAAQTGIKFTAYAIHPDGRAVTLYG